MGKLRLGQDSGSQRYAGLLWNGMLVIYSSRCHEERELPFRSLDGTGLEGNVSSLSPTSSCNKRETMSYWRDKGRGRVWPVFLTDHIGLQLPPPRSGLRGRTPSPHQTDTCPGEARFPRGSWWPHKIRGNGLGWHMVGSVLR